MQFHVQLLIQIFNFLYMYFSIIHFYFSPVLFFLKLIFKETEAKGLLGWLLFVRSFVSLDLQVKATFGFK